MPARALLVLMLALGLGTSVALAVQTAPADAATKTIRVSTAKVPNIGTVLTTSSGLTLYRFTQDPAGGSACTGACAKIWPPMLAAKGTHIKGPKGVKGLSLIKVGNGRFQVAFHNVALYRFQGDKKKGQVKGQGVGNAWFAVLKSGIPTPAAPAASTATQPPASPTTKPVTPITPAPTPSPSPSSSSQRPVTPMTSPPPPPPTTPPTTPRPPTTTPPTSPPTTTPTTTPAGGGGGISF